MKPRPNTSPICRVCSIQLDSTTWHSQKQRIDYRICISCYNRRRREQARKKREESPSQKIHIDLSGQRFGRLLLLERLEQGSRNNSPLYKCLCDCGAIVEKWLKYLQNGDTKSCGCLHKEIAQNLGRNLSRLPPGESSMNNLISSYINSAKSRSLDYQLTREEFKNITSSPCSYCGTEPKQIRKNKTAVEPYIYNGIDRVNPEQGYTIDNCVASCATCNYAKHTMNREEFIEWVNRVYIHLVGGKNGL